MLVLPPIEVLPFRKHHLNFQYEGLFFISRFYTW